jgi:hypothetical protein
MKFLPKIAALMRAEADAAGIARHSLKRGLHLTLRRDNGDLILSLTRDGSPPGEMEEQICRRAFEVPETAGRQTNIVEAWHVVRFRWDASPQQLGFSEESLGAAAPLKSTYYQKS